MEIYLSQKKTCTVFFSKGKSSLCSSMLGGRIGKKRETTAGWISVKLCEMMKDPSLAPTLETHQAGHFKRPRESMLQGNPSNKLTSNSHSWAVDPYLYVHEPPRPT